MATKIKLYVTKKRLYNLVDSRVNIKLPACKNMEFRSRGGFSRLEDITGNMRFSISPCMGTVMLCIIVESEKVYTVSECSFNELKAYDMIRIREK